MGVLKRIADSIGDTIRNRGGSSKDMSIDGTKLSELSDEELERELRRRRAKRGYSGPSEDRLPSSRRSRRGGRTPGWKVRQWYRNLELEPGAPREDVEDAYKRLNERYSPERHADDPEKHRAARQLVAGLREAYLGILRSLDEDE